MFAPDRSILNPHWPHFWERPKSLLPFPSWRQMVADEYDKRSDCEIKTLRTRGGQPIKVDIDRIWGNWTIHLPFKDFIVPRADLKECQAALNEKIAEVCQRPINENEGIVTVALLKNGREEIVLGFCPKGNRDIL